MDCYTFNYIFAAFLLYYYYHSQNQIEEAYRKGVLDGTVDGFRDGWTVGRAETDEDMYEQGRERGIAESQKQSGN